MGDNHGISVLHDPGSLAKFDLVAVHGINGHPYHTWTYPNDAMWLEEFLPEDMQHTRVMTFGYNAQVFSTSKGLMADFAEQLLQFLTSIRRLTMSVDRPIIFLSHSLGGLVVKKALLLAQDAHDAAALRKSTIAVIFMGTPHRGSPLASYAETAVSCIKATGLKANKGNIHQLRLDSEELDDLGSQFGSLLQLGRIKVLTFYELKPTSIAGMRLTETLVVPKGSAKLGLGPPLETVIPVDADHRQIAQFPNRDSKQYNLVRSNLLLITLSYSQTVQTKECGHSDTDWNEVLLWLEALRTQSRSIVHREHTEGTCRWIYDKDHFISWIRSNSSAGLWISGKPGVGKTVLSTFISQNLKSEEENQVIVLHCNSYQSTNEPFHALVRDVLLQTLQFPNLASLVRERLLDLKSRTSGLSTVAFETILEVIHKSLFGTPKVVLILDGVDELDQKSLELKYFLCTLADISREAGMCKVLILSRSTQSLELLLEGWQHLTISPSDSMRDISIFLDRKLKILEHLHDHHDEIVRRLVECSRGLFLWADLAASELSHLRTWNEILTLLESGNCGIESMYVSIIKQLDTSSKAICNIRARALLLIAVARRPFRLEEILELLAIEVSQGFIDEGNKILGGWNTLSRASGPFLQIDELGTVELIHVSAKEFLLTDPWAMTLARDNLIDGSADVEMTCLCLSYLNLNVFDKTGEDPQEGVDGLSQKYLFLEYASQYWADHFIKSNKITSSQLILLEKFLHSNCSVTWTTTFYPHFSVKRGETIRTIFESQRLILANLERKLRLSGNIEPLRSERCVERCRRLLLDSTQHSLRIEHFNSGPVSKATLEKKLRLAECYDALNEFDSAEKIVLEAFKAAKDVLGEMQPLTLQLSILKLHIRMRIHQLSSTIRLFNGIPELLDLAGKCTLVFGVDNFETISCRQNISRIHLLREEFPQARKYLEPLHKKVVETHGLTSPITQTITNDLAICANMQEEYNFAEIILHASYPELEKAAAEKVELDIFTLSPRVLGALAILAALFGAKDEDRRSEIIHQRVIEGLMAQSGERSRLLYESAINKGQAIRDQFKYREARAHYKKWLKKCDKNLGTESEESHEMRRSLIDLDQQEKKWKEVSQSLEITGTQFATWLGFSGFAITSHTAIFGIVVAAFVYFLIKFVYGIVPVL